MLNSCLLNEKIDRLCSSRDEIVTVYVHKYSVIMPCRNMTS